VRSLLGLLGLLGLLLLLGQHPQCHHQRQGYWVQLLVLHLLLLLPLLLGWPLQRPR